MTENRHPTSNSKPIVSHAILMQVSFFLKGIKAKSWSAIVQRLFLLIFLNSLSLAPALGFDLASAAFSALGGAFSGPAATGLSYVTNSAITSVNELITIDKDDKNTINIRVNSLSEEGVKKICKNNVLRLNTENKKICDGNASNIKHFKGILQKNEAEIDAWLERYLLSIHCIQKVCSFLSVYEDVYTFLISEQEKLNGGNEITKKRRLELSQQYQTFISHIQDRRKKIGAMLNNQFPYIGEGGPLDRSTASNSRKSQRLKVFGVSSFDKKDHERTSSELDNINPNPQGKLDNKLNSFATAYLETVCELHRNHTDILAEYHTDRVSLYEFLDLTKKGLQKLPSYTSTSTSSPFQPMPTPSGRRARLDSLEIPTKSRASSSAPLKSMQFNRSPLYDYDDQCSDDEDVTTIYQPREKPNIVALKSNSSAVVSHDSSDDESGDESGDGSEGEFSDAESDEEDAPKKTTTSTSHESDDDSDDSDTSDGLLK